MNHLSAAIRISQTQFRAKNFSSVESSYKKSYKGIYDSGDIVPAFLKHDFWDSGVMHPK